MQKSLLADSYLNQIYQLSLIENDSVKSFLHLQLFEGA